MLNDTAKDTASARELFQSLDGMEGLPAQTLAPRPHGVRALTRAVYPGVLAAATVAVAASWLSQRYGAPVMLFALLIGMAFHFLHEEGRCVAGIEFSSKPILRVGVALLGARITASEIAGLGLEPIAVVVAAIVSTMLVGVFAARALGLGAPFGILSSGSTAICGAAAALAIAAVLPRTRDSERDTVLTVVTVTALSTVAMIVYPAIAVALGFDHVRAGVFLGGAIHDVAQVVGAGYTVSPQTGDTATYVKLLRVALLLPVVLFVSFFVARTAGPAAKTAPRPGVPLFLIGFAALVVVNSLGWLTAPVTGAISDVSRWCLVTAIAALGMKTSFRDLAAVGWRPIALIVVETLWIGALVLCAATFLL